MIREVLSGLVVLLCFACAEQSPAVTATTRAPMDDGGTGDGPSPASLKPEVPFTVVNDTDTPCETTMAAPTALYRPPFPVDLAGLERAGIRRLAQDPLGDGFVLFDADGTSARPEPIRLGNAGRAAASDEGVVAAAFDDASNVLVRAYDLTGVPLGPSSTLGTGMESQRLWIGRAQRKTIVLWQPDATHISTRLLMDDQVVDAAFDLENGANEAFDNLSVVTAASTVGDGSEFLVVWALRRSVLLAYRVYAVLVNARGFVGLTRIVLGTETPIRMIRAVPHSEGVSVLAEFGGEPLVIPLDPLGRLVAETHKFEGTRGSIDLAGGEGELGLVASRKASGNHAFRRLGTDGKSLGPWVCLDPTSHLSAFGASITVDGAGYAIILRSQGGGTDLLRVDRTGQKPLP